MKKVGVLAQWMHEAVTWCHSLIFVKFLIHCCSKQPTCPFYPSLHSQTPPFVGRLLDPTSSFLSPTLPSLLLAAFTAVATDSHSLPFLLLEIPVLWDPTKIPFRPSTSSVRTSISVSEKFLFFVFLSIAVVTGKVCERKSYLHTQIFTRCFALTIYGYLWACEGRDFQFFHVRTSPGWFWFINGKLRAGVRANSFINLNFFVRTPFPGF